MSTEWPWAGSTEGASIEVSYETCAIDERMQCPHCGGSGDVRVTGVRLDVGELGLPAPSPTCESVLPPPSIDHGPKLGERQHFRFPAPPTAPEGHGQ